MRAFDPYVKPILEYCSYVWKPNLYQDIDLFDGVQRSFTGRVFWKCSLLRLDHLNKLNVVHRQRMQRSHFVTDLTMFIQFLKIS